MNNFHAMLDELDDLRKKIDYFQKSCKPLIRDMNVACICDALSEYADLEYDPAPIHEVRLKVSRGTLDDALQEPLESRKIMYEALAAYKPNDSMNDEIRQFIVWKLLASLNEW